jgi:hypothetical protein
MIPLQDWLLFVALGLVLAGLAVRLALEQRR